MTIRVEHKENVTVHTAGEKWVIDDDGRLHVIGNGGNLASYNNGYWANVAHIDAK